MRDETEVSLRKSFEPLSPEGLEIEKSGTGDVWKVGNGGNAEGKSVGEGV